MHAIVERVVGRRSMARTHRDITVAATMQYDRRLAFKKVPRLDLITLLAKSRINAKNCLTDSMLASIDTHVPQTCHQNAIHWQALFCEWSLTGSYQRL